MGCDTEKKNDGVGGEHNFVRILESWRGVGPEKRLLPPARCLTSLA